LTCDATNGNADELIIGILILERNTPEMTSQQRRPAMVSESEMDGCMKGVVMLVICAFYAIVLFVTAAVCSLVYRGIKSGFSELLTHTQIVEVKKEEKYDYNHNSVRPLKHLNIGSK